MDLDGNGWLSKTEIDAAMRTFMMDKGQEPEQADIDLAFKKMDKNKDGKISFREFLSMTKEILTKGR